MHIFWIPPAHCVLENLSVLKLLPSRPSRPSHPSLKSRKTKWLWTTRLSYCVQNHIKLPHGHPACPSDVLWMVYLASYFYTGQGSGRDVVNP